MLRNDKVQRISHFASVLGMFYLLMGLCGLAQFYKRGVARPGGDAEKLSQGLRNYKGLG